MKKQEIILHWGHFTLTLILAWLLMPSLSYAGHQASEGCKNRTSLEAHLALKMFSSVHELKGIKTFTRSDQTILDNSTIKIACGLRLGTALCQPHKCKSGADVDKFGRHGLSCKSAEGRHPRHTHSNIILKEALGSAHLAAGKSPDGLTLIPWSNEMKWEMKVSNEY